MLSVRFSCGGTTINKGRQRTWVQVCLCTQLGAPATSPCGPADPDTDVQRDSLKRPSLQLLWSHPVHPTKLTQKCPERLASPLEDCLLAPFSCVSFLQCKAYWPDSNCYSTDKTQWQVLNEAICHTPPHPPNPKRIKIIRCMTIQTCLNEIQSFSHCRIYVCPNLIDQIHSSNLRQRLSWLLLL